MPRALRDAVTLPLALSVLLEPDGACTAKLSSHPRTQPIPANTSKVWRLPTKKKAHRVAGEAGGAHLLTIDDWIACGHGPCNWPAVVQHLKQLTEVAEHPARQYE